MKLVENNVAVEAPKNADQTKGGLYLAPTADIGQFISSIIVQAGPNTKTVHIGDLVHFNKFNASKVTVDGTEYYVFPETAVLVIEN